MSITELEKLINEHFPGLWNAVEFGLANCATLTLKQNTTPGTSLFVGGSGSSKTTVTSFFLTSPRAYRSDAFSPAAFVSNAANKSPTQLEKIDLLPRIRHHILVTSELAPIFRGKEDELLDRFSILTTVLDGNGLILDKGTHGRRGYQGDYHFIWIGATTPLDPRAWKIMAQLGSRLFFFVMDDHEVTVDDLLLSDEGPSYDERLVICQDAIKTFLTDLFDAHGGVRGVDWDIGQDCQETRLWIARLSRLLSILRSIPAHQFVDELTASKPEIPRRSHAVLRNFARGRALLCGRRYLDKEDLSLLIRVVLSSIPSKYAKILTAMILNGGEVTTPQVQEALREKNFRIRHPDTARRIMEELDLKGGVFTFTPGAQGIPGRLTFSPPTEEWFWLRDTESLATLFQRSLGTTEPAFPIPQGSE